jgi:hypothetical protein
VSDEGTGATRRRPDRVGFEVGGHLVLPGALAEVAVCLVLAALGAWFLTGALALPKGRGAITPGTFPAIMAGGLIVLCLAQAALSLATARRVAAQRIERALPVAGGILLLLLFPALVERFGFYPVAALWLPAFALLAGQRHWTGLAGAVAVVLLLARGVFEAILGTPLP